MIADIDTGAFHFVKLLGEYTRRAATNEAATDEPAKSADKKEPAEPKELRWTRNGLWILGGGFAGCGLVLTAARVEGWFAPDTATIVWAIALMLLSAICAAVAQVTINRHVVVAAVREHTPADIAVLARIATMVQRVSSAQAKMDERLDNLAELIPLAASEVARKAYAAAVKDLRAEFAAEREAFRRDLEETLKRAKADAYVDALSGDNTVVMFPPHKRQDPA